MEEINQQAADPGLRPTRRGQKRRRSFQPRGHSSSRESRQGPSIRVPPKTGSQARVATSSGTHRGAPGGGSKKPSTRKKKALTGGGESSRPQESSRALPGRQVTAQESRRTAKAPMGTRSSARLQAQVQPVNRPPSAPSAPPEEAPRGTRSSAQLQTKATRAQRGNTPPSAPLPSSSSNDALSLRPRRQARPSATLSKPILRQGSRYVPSQSRVSDNNIAGGDTDHEDMGKEQLRCDNCGELVSFYTDLKTHQRTSCSNKVTQKKAENEWKKERRDNVGYRSESKVCEICGHSTNDAKNLERHQKGESGCLNVVMRRKLGHLDYPPNNFQCIHQRYKTHQDCTKIYKEWRRLQTHYKNIHKGPWRRCQNNPEEMKRVRNESKRQRGKEELEEERRELEEEIRKLEAQERRQLDEERRSISRESDSDDKDTRIPCPGKGCGRKFAKLGIKHHQQFTCPDLDLGRRVTLKRPLPIYKCVLDRHHYEVRYNDSTRSLGNHYKKFHPSEWLPPVGRPEQRALIARSAYIRSPEEVIAEFNARAEQAAAAQPSVASGSRALPSSSNSSDSPPPRKVARNLTSALEPAKRQTRSRGKGKA